MAVHSVHTTREGTIQFETQWSDAEAYAFLNQHIFHLSSFGASLAKTPLASLSPRQLEWVHYLAKEVSDKKTTVAAPPLYASLMTLLKQGQAAGLHRPRLVLRTVQVVYSVEGRRPGFAYVKDNGRVCGVISPNGLLETRRLSNEQRDELDTAAKDPAAYAAIVGKDIGRCCFCGLMLENPESVGHGYGPICADKYGLPWGNGGGTRSLLHEKEEELKILLNALKPSTES